MFFSYSASESGITTPLLNQIVSVFSYVVMAIVCVMTAVSFIMRQKKTANKALIWGCGILSAIYMIFFMVMSKLIGLFEISFENLNLYLIYFLMTAFSTAIVLYSAIRNLIKIKNTPVTFAKSDEPKKPIGEELIEEETAEASEEVIETEPTESEEVAVTE
ncbi:MAG: hypothetical protein IJD11_03505 [Oscillospiraceae bacterium]|nr:hypothetical protein [Oscillospiraceae bacterium]